MFNLPIKNKLEGELFRIKPMKPVAKVTTPHGHKNYLEIIYLRKGSGTHQIDHHCFEVTPAVVYLILPGQLHSWDLKSIPEGFVIMVRKDFFIDTPLTSLFFDRFPHPFPQAIELRSTHSDVESILASIVKEYDSKEQNFQGVVQSYLSVLFNLFRREVTLDEPLHLPSQLTDFMATLETNLTEKRTLKQLANEVGLSTKKLNALCKKHLGKTAGEIVSFRITIEAQRRLLYTSDNLSEIAFRLGFADLSHFNKFFKRQTGHLPGQYRKSIA
jgi:AraC-like DNA-binding protein